MENQQGKSKIVEFEIDDVYTSSFDLFTVDVDENGNQELVICLYGHDYSTEIYKITSKKHEKVISYYMCN